MFRRTPASDGHSWTGGLAQKIASTQAGRGELLIACVVDRSARPGNPASFLAFFFRRGWCTPCRTTAQPSAPRIASRATFALNQPNRLRSPLIPVFRSTKLIGCPGDGDLGADLKRAGVPNSA